MSLADSLPASAETQDEDLASLDPSTVRLWRALAPLDPPVRRTLLASGQVTRHASGAPFALEDRIAVVIDGCLSVDAGLDGVCAAVAGPGRIVAYGAGRVTGAWIHEGELYETTLTDWHRLGGEPASRHLIEAAARAQAAMSRRVACAVRHQATPRLADLFSAIQEAVGPRRILLSQERLGAMLGLRRTTVNASSRTLQAAGALRTMRGRIRLIDPGRLEDFACGCRLAGTPPVGHPASDRREGTGVADRG